MSPPPHCGHIMVLCTHEACGVVKPVNSGFVREDMVYIQIELASSSCSIHGDLGLQRAHRYHGLSSAACKPCMWSSLICRLIFKSYPQEVCSLSRRGVTSQLCASCSAVIHKSKVSNDRPPVSPKPLGDQAKLCWQIKFAALLCCPSHLAPSNDEFAVSGSPQPKDAFLSRSRASRSRSCDLQYLT